MNMKQILGVLVALTVATTMFAGGALAQPVDDDSVTVVQNASASVDQSQTVTQWNDNYQEASASGSSASVSQSNVQSNYNEQVGIASASNEANVNVTNEEDDFPPGPPT